MADISPLRRRMIEDMTVRNLSPATQRSYVHAVAKFSRFFARSPDKLTLEDVRTFQVHLASKGVAWASLNQTVAALRFFYGVTLGMAEVPERIAYAREPRRPPAGTRRLRLDTSKNPDLSRADACLPYVSGGRHGFSALPCRCGCVGWA